MAIVEGMLLINGLVELIFGLLSLIWPENIFLQLMFPFSHGSEAQFIWSAAILALGVIFLHAAVQSIRHGDQRVCQSPLLGACLYHICVLYVSNLRLQSHFNAETVTESLSNPELIGLIILPEFTLPIVKAIGFDSNIIQLTPLDFLINTLGTHFSLLLLTAIAFCVCNTTGSQELLWLQYQQELSREERLKNVKMMLQRQQQNLNQQDQQNDQKHLKTTQLPATNDPNDLNQSDNDDDSNQSQDEDLKNHTRKRIKQTQRYLLDQEKSRLSGK